MSPEDIERLAQPYASYGPCGENDEDVLLGWWFDNTDDLVAFANAVLDAVPLIEGEVAPFGEIHFISAKGEACPREPLGCYRVRCQLGNKCAKEST